MRHSHPSPRVSHALKQSALSAHLSKTFKRPPFAAQYSHAQICVRLFPRFPAPRSPLHTASITCDCHRRVDNPAPLVIPLPGAYLRIAPRSSGPTLHFSARLSRRRATRLRENETKSAGFGRNILQHDSHTVPGDDGVAD